LAELLRSVGAPQLVEQARGLAFRHLRLRLALVKEEGAGSPGTVPDVRWPNPS